MQKYLWELCCLSSLTFCLTQLATQVPSLTSNKRHYVGIHPCHSGEFGTWDPCESRKPHLNLHALNNWDCMDRPHVTWDLIRTLCEPASGLKNPSMVTLFRRSQELRMHIVSEAKTLLPGQIMRELISNVDHRPASRWMPNPGMKMKRLLITQKKNNWRS